MHWGGKRIFLGFSTAIIDFSNLVNLKIIWLNPIGSRLTEKSDSGLFVKRLRIGHTLRKENPIPLELTQYPRWRSSGANVE